MGPHRIAPIVLAVVIGTIGVAQQVKADDGVVAILLRGRYYTAPATVQITVSVPPKTENRSLRIEVDGESLFRSTELELNGASEKRLHTMEIRSLPAGDYTIRAEVFGEHSLLGRATDGLWVTGSPSR